MRRALGVEGTFMYGVIVVGTDGSQTASRAVGRAIALCRQTGAALHIVTAYRPASVQKLQAQRESLPEEFAWMVSATSDAESILKTASESALDAGVPTETHHRQGDPSQAILGLAGELGADLIVVGSRGIERRVLSSVPSTIMREANCDVLLVHTI
jgi:nucleotide-binding universal stress UspA family protein